MRTGYSLRAILLASFLTIPALGAPRGGAPRFTKRATELGTTSSSRMVPITVWLQIHGAAALDQTVQARHDRTSSGFQQWDSDAAIDAAHAPTAAEVATVSTYLTASGLTVTGVGAHNLFVTARGTAAQVQSALKVELRDFSLGNRRYFANTAAPSLPSHVQPLVAFVGGLTNHGAKPMNVRALDSARAPVRPSLTATPGGSSSRRAAFGPRRRSASPPPTPPPSTPATASGRTSTTPRRARSLRVGISPAISIPRTT